LSRPLWRPSSLTPPEVCVRGLSPATPLRTSAELRPLQFHCGKPPPAAEPRTLITMAPGQVAAGPGLRQGQKRSNLKAEAISSVVARLPGERTLEFQSA